MRIKNYFLVIGFLVSVVTGTLYADKNLLVNGSFEGDPNKVKVASGWNGEIQKGAKGKFFLDDKIKYEGETSQAITRLVEEGQLIRVQQTVKVKPNAVYNISVAVLAKKKYNAKYSIGVYEFGDKTRYHKIVDNVVPEDKWRKWNFTLHVKPTTHSIKLHICV